MRFNRWPGKLSQVNCSAFAMSQQRRRLLELAIACCDLLVTTFSFYVAFWLRFESGYWPHGGPEIDQYLIILGGILPLWLGLFSFFEIGRAHV